VSTLAFTSAQVSEQTAPPIAGFYPRDNLADTGAIPAPGPYGLCPDIIGSAEPISDAQSALSTLDSWKTMYSVEPMPGETTYYYVRGMNGAAEAINGSLTLYWAPANLVMFPSIWKGNELSPTATATVRVSADPGHIGVGDVPFVLSSPPTLADPATYMAFVACASDTSTPIPPPVISSWLDMSALETQRRDIRVRNTSMVSATAAAWYRRLAFDVLSCLPAASIMVSITARGFIGNTMGLIGDMFGADRQPILLVPAEITQDGAARTLQISVTPGQSLNFTVQYWNTGLQPSPGATITLSADYVVPDSELVQAGERALVHPHRGRFLADAAKIQPVAMAPLGSATFTVG
jgi:hypothetical protein